MKIQFDCSPAELADRVERRAADRKRIDGEKRMRRELDRHIWRRKEFEDQRIGRGERRQAAQVAMRDAAQAEWLAFTGRATAEQIEAFKKKYRPLMIPWSVQLKPVTIIPAPLPLPLPPSNVVQLPVPPVTLMAPRGEILPSDAEDSLGCVDSYLSQSSVAAIVTMAK